MAGLPTDRPTERPTDFSQSVLTKPQKKAYGQLFQPKIDIKGELTYEWQLSSKKKLEICLQMMIFKLALDSSLSSTYVSM